mmetsp:Transcript_30044/g.93849  ORF Transcript_30044/g.93849 Transcript_30044/m.93849 type:complete len:120 (+) Transcript_30044:602-961(+)
MNSLPARHQVLSDLHLMAGQLLERLPASRCSGGSCLPHAADAYQRALANVAGHEAASAALDRLAKLQPEAAPHHPVPAGEGGTADAAGAPAASAPWRGWKWIAAVVPPLGPLAARIGPA